VTIIARRQTDNCHLISSKTIADNIQGCNNDFNAIKWRPTSKGRLWEKLS